MALADASMLYDTFSMSHLVTHTKKSFKEKKIG